MKMFTRGNRAILAMLATVALHSLMIAQNLSSIPSIDSVARFEAIPSDLTFEMLQLPGFKAEQPGTMSRLLVSLGSLVDRTGKINPGVAVSFAPYQLIQGKDLQLKDYVGNFWTRLLSNSQLSLGTSPGQGVDSTQDWGIGLRVVFINTGDGRLDTNYLNLLFRHGVTLLGLMPDGSDKANASDSFRRLRRSAEKVVEGLNNAVETTMKKAQVDETARPYLDQLSTIADSIREIGFGDEADTLKQRVGDAAARIQISMAKLKIQADGRSSVWNTTSLDLSIGTVYQSSSGSVAKSDFRRVNLWLNGGFGLGSSQLLMQIGGSLDRSLDGRKDSAYAIGGLMYRFGNPQFRAGLGFNAERNIDKGSMNMVFEISVNRNLWIVPSLSMEAEKGKRTVWIPGLSFKTTGALFGS